MPKRIRHTLYSLQRQDEEPRGEDNTKRTLRTNQGTDIDVMKITLISYDNANVWRNVKEIQLTTFQLRIH